MACGKGTYLRDDSHEVTLSAALIAAPPLELWPALLARAVLPADVEAELVARLREEGAPRLWPRRLRRGLSAWRLAPQEEALTRRRAGGDVATGGAVRS